MRPALRLGFLAACLALAACAGWSPAQPFQRDAPLVREAIGALDAGDAAAAAARLEEYLSTGPCKDGSIGTPDLLRRRADGTFDLGLSLFRVGEQFGRRFGEEEANTGAAPPGASGGSDVSEQTRAQRHAQVVCARALVQAIAEDTAATAELRVRAHYLDGNLAFLDGEYEEAVRAYDRALTIEPGEPDAGDAVARDAAWNRAIALRRIDDKKDSGSDAAPDGSPGDSGGGDAARDGSQGPPDSGSDGSRGREDSGPDAQNEAGPPPPPPDAGDRPDAAPPPLTNEDERMLDQLENAPTLQQEEARRLGKKRHPTVDK
jgi:tetratricopeptide (TPR) repeat protein